MVEQGSDPFADLDLDGLFTAIETGKLKSESTQPQQPLEQSPVSKSFRTTFIVRCIDFVLSPRRLRLLEINQADIRVVADYFRTQSAEWKEFNARTSLTAQKADDVEIIKSLTYTEMAEFAKGRFEEFSEESGRVVPFSDRQKEMQHFADHWAWVEQVIREAEDQEKKNPN